MCPASCVAASAGVLSLAAAELRREHEARRVTVPAEGADVGHAARPGVVPVGRRDDDALAPGLVACSGLRSASTPGSCVVTSTPYGRKSSGDALPDVLDALELGRAERGVGVNGKRRADTSWRRCSTTSRWSCARRSRGRSPSSRRAGCAGRTCRTAAGAPARSPSRARRRGGILRHELVDEEQVVGLVDGEVGIREEQLAQSGGRHVVLRGHGWQA